LIKLLVNFKKQMSYITDPKGAQFSLFKVDSDASDATMVGQRFHTEDGREVVLVGFSGGSAITPGLLVGGTPADATQSDLAVTTSSSASSNTVTFTLGGSSVAANEYQGGVLVTTGGTGAGQTLKIQSHPAVAGGNPITMTLEDALTLDVDNSTTVTLMYSPYISIIGNTSDYSSSPVGVTLYTIPAGNVTKNYAFVVCKGLTACLNDGGTAIGLGMSASASVDGALVITAATLNEVASAYVAGIDGEYQPVMVNL
jgi:hypothetical protein